mgnify:CR=1 FL=1
MTPLNSTIFTLFLAGLLFILFFTSRTPVKVGQVISDPFLCHNGICTWSYRLDMKGSTNTPCSVRSPESTSTIVHASALLNIQATSSLLMDIGHGNNTNATTTSLASTTIAANAKGNLFATSTLTGFYPATSTVQSLGSHIIGPNQYLNLRFGREAGITKGSVGVCEFIFRVL